MNLRLARCHFHAEREAAALCARCQRAYCRECVTEDRGAMVCLPCLRRGQEPGGTAPRRWALVWQLAGAALGLLWLYCLFFLAGQWVERWPLRR